MQYSSVTAARFLSRPNRFVALEEMPINLNGKIDRTLLKQQYIKEN